MRLPSRSADDADVIRARLRTLLAEQNRGGGWLPDDEPGDGDLVDAGVQGTAWSLEDDENDPGTDDAGPGLPEGIGRHRAPGTAVRWDPGRPGARALWLVGLLAALLLVAWTWLNRPTVDEVPQTRSEGTAVSSAPVTPPVGEAGDTSPTVVVSVVGLVARPGLVTLPTGARVADALAAAGGLLPEADPASVNLAAVVADGEQVTVGVPGAPAAGPDAAPGSAGPLDLNTAGVAELDALPGIGPVLAQRIVDHRTREGPFTSVGQLDDVPGIGPATAAELAELVGV
ncbi:helix-hairpin-helix domain-containing protein [Blastococcus sp. CT_GayMR20]|uniref:ComEA family DNA-binding protein n=1 Tax=Blastococcus sp. CT_GayMR20 TaxID=2559609 RepID=UPI0010738812|nr:ComEA family DNA-binding protein [Blastococcus sp. CT_GayMR20]TFV77345.1 helix-hairpin-helix domain-containing protein [Blastococcus sp. CT_GayMR20]